MVRNVLRAAGLLALPLLASINPHPAAATTPVDYLKICSAFGANYYFIPGTNTCLNARTGDTKRATAGGTLVALLMRTPGKWTKSPSLSCKGRLQTIGTFTPANLTLNSKQVYETPAVPFAMSDREFLSGVMLSGRFSANATNFCISMRDKKGNSAVLGCQDLSLMDNTPATWLMIPTNTRVPRSFTTSFSFVGSNAAAQWSGAATSGSVTLSACFEQFQ